MHMKNLVTQFLHTLSNHNNTPTSHTSEVNRQAHFVQDSSKEILHHAFQPSTQVLRLVVHCAVLTEKGPLAWHDTHCLGLRDSCSSP